MDQNLLNLHTFGELKSAGYKVKPVRIEMRDNLLRFLRNKERIMPGIIGYDDTVLPEIENGVLAGHHMVFLGERGQAKSRIIRSLVSLLDDAPVVSAVGRSFDVATHYVPRRPEISLELQTAQVVRSALRDHEGDVLCFLPGAAEIRRVQRTLEEPGSDAAVKIRVRSLTSGAFTGSICAWTLAPNSTLKLMITEDSASHSFKYVQYR